MHHFKWLVFLEFYEFKKNLIEKLKIPYNCQFILCFNLNSTTRTLIEVYNIKNRTFYTDLGIFQNGKISLANNYSYLRRMNLNGTKLIMNTDKVNNFIINFIFTDNYKI